MQSSTLIFEINTRVWLKRFGNDVKIKDVPFDYFLKLKDKGFEYVWFMGIWETCTKNVKKYCFSNDLINSYNKSLKDWNENDVIGSPYAVNSYSISPLIGTENDILELKNKLNSIGLKLVLDFVVNHFGSDTDLICKSPEIFLQTDEESYKRDPHTFFSIDNKFFAHGRDPFFPAWTDTVQLNFFSTKAREFLINTLVNISEYCDGVRCDMAMLPLNNVFHNTWIGVLNKKGEKKPSIEFWEEAIKKVKSIKKDFVFMGEAYWDLEWTLQQLGFDYTYDKKLTDRLEHGDVRGVKEHLKAEKDYQLKSIRFIENHDEQRAVTKFGKYRSLAAATVISTIPGLKLYHDGQFEGKKIKLPVQLGREPQERVSNTVSKFYDKIFKIIEHNIFKNGDFHLLEPHQASPDNFTCENFLAWYWKLGVEYRIVIINYSEEISQCRIKMNFEHYSDDVKFLDLSNEEVYIRNINEIRDKGLFVELKPFNSHIFSVKL